MREKTYIIYRLLLVATIFLATSGYLLSQVNEYGVPFITNYSPEEYKSAEQNWSMAQDNRGVIYIGNNESILEYDGVNWRIIKIPLNSSVRSLTIDDEGTIYVGAVGEFGYLSPDKTGDLKYHSLSIQMDSMQFGNVYKTYAIGDKVHFCSQKIFVFENKKFSEVIELPKYTFYTFNINNKFYAGNYVQGLIEYKDGEFNVSKGGSAFERINIMALYPYSDNELLVFTFNNGIYIYNTETGESSNDSFLSETARNALLEAENNLYQAEILQDGSFAIATLHSGCLIVDHKGELINHLTREDGIKDATVTNAYSNPTSSQPLWFPLNNGVSKVLFNSPFRVFNDKQGLKGGCNELIRFNGVLYVATSSGVFYLDYNDKKLPMFHQVENVFLPLCFTKFKIPGTNQYKLLVGTQKGIYEITPDHKPVPLDQGGQIDFLNKRPADFLYYNIYSLSQSTTDSSILYIGAEELTELRYSNGRWKENFVIPQSKLFNDQARSLVEDEKGRIWITTNLNGIIRIEIKDNDTIYNAYSVDDGLPTNNTNFIYKFDNELIFATIGGIYRFEESSNKFMLEPKFGKQLSDSSKAIYRISRATNGTYWFSANSNRNSNNAKWAETISFNEDGSIIKDSIAFTLLNPNLTIESFYHDNDVTWIGNSKGVYSFDSRIKKDYKQKFNALVRRVFLGEDSIVFEGTYFKITDDGDTLTSLEQPNELKYEFNYTNNNISFHFSSPFFEMEEHIRFSYFLEGNDPDWSKWGTETYKDFTNLDEGDYVFKVKAQNIYNLESEIATFEFSVLPPWYRTIWALVSYVILSIVLIVVIVKLYTRKLEREKIRLEGIVEERTAEVVRQKEAIEKQKDHIEEINLEMTDSIHYAERIQRAILPHAEEILPDHYILFKPKDIVSGDFYWAGKINDWIMATSADCTGHGVPGAFMSMLGVTFLNEIVKEKDVTEAGHVLDHLRQHVIRSLQQKGAVGEQKDGMDMSFCAINEKTGKVQWAGANNSMYFIREKVSDEDTLSVIANGEEVIYEPNMSTDDFHLFEIRPDKMPIAIYIKMDNFVNNIIQFEKGDSIYMFTDGYPDQFGGPKGKKFKYKPFKRLILENQDKSMQEQSQILDDAIEEWKSYPDPISGHDTCEQVDDICVIGIKWDKNL